MIKWLVANLKVSKKEATVIAAQMLKEKKITHCSSDMLPFTEACFYRFVQ